MALTVFACEPEWAALTTELAPQATLVSATHALQDPHYIEARPSLIAKLRRADLAVCTGAELESGWLPMLQQRAGNPRVLPGQPGLFLASEAVSLIDQRPDADRAEGHVHAEGNPHFQLDPNRIRKVARALSQRLAEVDPEHRAEYESRYLAWVKQWDQHREVWLLEAAPLRGKTIVSRHTGFEYLWQWLGMTQIADLEPKPGVPPTPAHLRSLVALLKNNEAPIAIAQALYHDTQAMHWLHDQTGVSMLALPSTLTDKGPAATLTGLFDSIIHELLRAAESATE